MAEHAPHGPAAHDNPDVDHEKRDVNVAGVLKFAAGLVTFAVFVHLVLAWLFGVLARKTDRDQPRLTPIARQEREREQKAAAKRVQELDRNANSGPAPQPAQVYERLQGIPGPRLQVDDEADLAALRAEEAAKLKGYHWVDRKAGVVRIPIERAMHLLTDPKKAGALGVKVKGQGGR